MEKDKDGKTQIKAFEIGKQRDNISQNKTKTNIKSKSSLSKFKDKSVKESANLNSNNNAGCAKSKANLEVSVRRMNLESSTVNIGSKKPEHEASVDDKINECNEKDLFNCLIKYAKKGDRVAFIQSNEV